MSEHERLFTQEYNTLLSAPSHLIHNPGPHPNPNTLLSAPPHPPPLHPSRRPRAAAPAPVCALLSAPYQLN